MVGHANYVCWHVLLRGRDLKLSLKNLWDNRASFHKGRFKTYPYENTNGKSLRNITYGIVLAQ